MGCHYSSHPLMPASGTALLIFKFRQRSAAVLSKMNAIRSEMILSANLLSNNGLLPWTCCMNTIYILKWTWSESGFQTCYWLSPRCSLPSINSLWQSDACKITIIGPDNGLSTHWGHHWFSLWLVACTATSHYLNKCWLLVSWKLRNKLPWNLNRSPNIFV